MERYFSRRFVGNLFICTLLFRRSFTASTVTHLWFVTPYGARGPHSFTLGGSNDAPQRARPRGGGGGAAAELERCDAELEHLGV